MTLAAYSHDRGFLGDVASGAGWSGFVDWATGLDADLYQEVVHLAENGWEQEIDDLRDQLGAALEEVPPHDDSVRATAEGLLGLVAVLADDDALVVTDGVGFEEPQKKKHRKPESLVVRLTNLDRVGRFVSTPVLKKPARQQKWDEDKHPRADDGKFGSGGGGSKKPAKKPAKEPGGDGASTPKPGQPKSSAEAHSKLAKLGGMSWDALKAAGHAVAHIEHAAKEWTQDKVGATVERLPTKVQTVVRGVWLAARFGTKAAFVTYTAGQVAAERVAKAKGATPDEARRLRGILSAIDVAAFKPIALGLSATGLGGAVLPASFVPVGSLTYLAYSTATNPVATIRAARTAVKDAAKVVGLSKAATDQAAVLGAILDGVKAGGDRYVALYLAALDETKDAAKAAVVAKAALAGKKCFKGWLRFTKEACDDVQLLDVPNVPQGTSYSCGAAASCSVGKFFKVGPETEPAWAELLGTNPEDGTPPEKIIAGFKQLGCQVESRDQLTLDDLQAYFERGWPVLTPIQDYGQHSEYGKEEDGHWVVVIGLGMGLVIVQDPSADNVLADSGTDAVPGRVMIAEDDFLAFWHDRGANDTPYVRYGIAVGPPQGAVKTKGVAGG